MNLVSPSRFVKDVGAGGGLVGTACDKASEAVTGRGEKPFNLKTAIQPAKHAKHTKAKAIGLAVLLTRWVKVVGHSNPMSFACLPGSTAFSRFKNSAEFKK